MWGLLFLRPKECRSLAEENEMSRSFSTTVFLAVCLLSVLAAAAPSDSAIAKEDEELLTGTLSGKIVKLPAPFVEQNTAVLRLNGGELVALSEMDGSFKVANIPIGVHILTITMANVVFPTLRVDVTTGKKGAVKVRAFLNDAVPQSISGDVIEIAPRGKHEYFVPRETFSVMGLFKNPMVIMMVVTFGLMGMMKLMPQDELKHAMKDMTSSMSNLQQQGSGGGAAAVEGKTTAPSASSDSGVRNRKTTSVSQMD